MLCVWILIVRYKVLIVSYWALVSWGFHVLMEVVLIKNGKSGMKGLCFTAVVIQ